MDAGTSLDGESEHLERIAANVCLEHYRPFDGGVMRTKLSKGRESQAFHDFGSESPTSPTLEVVGRSIEVAPSLDIESLQPDPA